MRTRFTVVGGVNRVRPAARRAAIAAGHLGVAAGRCADIELAVHECIANALEHGHGGDPSVPIDVEVAREDDAAVVVSITDRACGGDVGPRAPGEHGRGQALMRVSADEVVEWRTTGMTTFCLRWSTPSGVGSGAEPR